MQQNRIPEVPDQAIFAEYASESNKKMGDGLNRRVFNRIEVADSGRNVLLADDGSVVCNPGTYRITGFSSVTTQDELWPAPLKHATTYPGYCVVYKKADEDKEQLEILPLALGVGSPTAAAYFAPSMFDLVAVFDEKTEICVGHQVGLTHGDVYLSIYEIDGLTSEHRAVARVAITKLA
jgi:hypothetical protein